MAVRPCGLGATIRFVTTTMLIMVGLIGMAACPAAVASQAWDSEPTPSVLVDSLSTSGGPSFTEDESGVPANDDGGVLTHGSLITDEPCIDSGCLSCNGTGCNACRKDAIFDPFSGPCHDKKACWIGRADALLLWRNSPPGGQLVDGDPLVPGSGLSAAGMESTPAAGPRFSIFRVNNCTGHAIEATYLRAANFRSLRPLGLIDVPYALTPPGIYNNAGLSFDTANADLGARVQSFEFNRHHCLTQCVRFLAGFRWIEWQEQFAMQTYLGGAEADYFQTNCFNDLYGGQIGLDANLLATRWVRFDSVVKAGAYYNVGSQTSQYTTGGSTSAVSISDSPLSGAFAGEVGLTGVIPLTCCLDIRLGYFGLWLSGIAQPTRQLAYQQLTPGQPTVGTINANGGVLLQGVSLGLEGRW